MTIIDWRKNPERLSMALEALSNPIVVEMMKLMDESSPAKQQQVVTDGFGATRVLGRIEGFQEYADLFRSLSQPLPTAQEDIRTTWGVDDIGTVPQ